MNIQTPIDTAPILLRERDGAIATLVLNRPAARNSLSEGLLMALSSAFTDIASDTSVRAVVIAANGPAFCAGHDLKELTSRRTDADGGRAYFRHIMQTCSAMMQQIVQLPDELSVGADYGLTVVNGASPSAYKLALFILSVEGQRTLAKHGFAAPALPQ